MITWITWTLLSAVQRRPLNIFTHSLTWKAQECSQSRWCYCKVCVHPIRFLAQFLGSFVLQEGSFKPSGAGNDWLISVFTILLQSMVDFTSQVWWINRSLPTCTKIIIVHSAFVTKKNKKKFMWGHQVFLTHQLNQSWYLLCWLAARGKFY